MTGRRHVAFDFELPVVEVPTVTAAEFPVGSVLPRSVQHPSPFVGVQCASGVVVLFAARDGRFVRLDPDELNATLKSHGFTVTPADDTADERPPAAVTLH